VVDHEKVFLIYNLITVQNLVVVSHTVCAHLGGPVNVGGSWSLGSERRGWCPRNTLLPTCIIVLNFISLGQTVWAYVGSQKFWVAGPRSLGMRPWLTN